MTDWDLDALYAHVDEVVEPLPIGAARKAQMRAELLAHLLDVCEQQCASGADVPIAVDATLRRFGAARDLEQELRADVSWVNRALYWVLWKKENFMLRLVAFCVLGLVLVLVGLAFVMPAVNQLAFQEFVGMSLILLVLGAILALGGVWSFAHGVRRYRMNGA